VMPTDSFAAIYFYLKTHYELRVKVGLLASHPTRLPIARPKAYNL